MWFLIRDSVWIPAAKQRSHIKSGNPISLPNIGSAQVCHFEFQLHLLEVPTVDWQGYINDCPKLGMCLQSHTPYNRLHLAECAGFK